MIVMLKAICPSRHFQQKGIFCLLLFSISPGLAASVHQLPAGAKIVVVGGSLTEIVYALGAQSQIIGRDLTSTYPQEAQNISDVGYMRALSAEGILSLSPEGILLIEGSGPPETLDILRKVSVPMSVISEGFDRQGVIKKIKMVGYALHKQEQANALAQNTDQQFARLDEITKKIVQKKRVLFVLSYRNGRIMAAGKGTAAHGIIELAGGINAITSYSGYKILNDEAIMEAAPDFILFMSNSSAITPDELLEKPVIRMTPAGKAQAFHQMDGLFLLGFGLRTASAAKILAQTFYPGISDPEN